MVRALLSAIFVNEVGLRFEGLLRPHVEPLVSVSPSEAKTFIIKGFALSVEITSENS